DRKAIENYKLQYEALKEKMREFPEKRFIVWTGALRAEDDSKPGCGERAKAFFDWVRDEWDEPGDNIFLWDFATVEGDGGSYLTKEHQNEPEDSHPAPEFCRKAAPLFGQRIVDVIEGRGDTASITGGRS
ncbi:MAG: hypothetical protein ACYTAN_12595, partial [Planctomycetota bacterium]